MPSSKVDLTKPSGVRSANSKTSTSNVRHSLPSITFPTPFYTHGLVPIILGPLPHLIQVVIAAARLLEGRKEAEEH